MPDTEDLLEQFLHLSPDRREALAMHLFETLPFPPHSFYFLKHRLTDFPSVISTPNVCGGSPRLVRTRIPVWLLQSLRSLGLSDGKILECYPTLTAGDLTQAWGYVAAHKAEIEKEIKENEQY